MNRHFILNEVANDSRYLTYCHKVLPIGDTYKDLFQYVCVYLLELDEKKLLDLHNSGGLRMYIVRIIWISAKSKTSGFQKEIKDNVLFESLEIDYKSEIDNIFESETDVCENINKIIELEKTESIKLGEYPASAKMFELYMELGNYKKVSTATKIPYKTVLKTIKEFRQTIKSKIK